MSDSTSLDQRLQAALTLVEEGRLDEAAERYDGILQQVPDHADALHLAGLVDFQRGKIAQGAERMQRALVLRPDSAQVHCNLALALRALGERAAARASCERALALDPEFGQAHYNLGVLAFDAGEYDEAETHYRAAIDAPPSLREAHYNLAHTLQRLGRDREAIAAYRRAVQIDPGYARAWLNLGNALHCVAEWDEALAVYRRFLDLTPNHPGAEHMIAAIEGTTTDRCPREFVTELFDSYAHQFDEVLVGDLGYRTPAELARLITEDGVGVRFGHALDLGCGTGLVGAALRPHCGRLVGVDLSAEMIAQAEARGVYDGLEQAELVEYLARSSSQFDLIVSGDVFVYLGDLEPCVRAVRSCSAQGARFAFSTEISEGADWMLQRTGRYAHHRRYVEALGHRNGFEVRARRELTLRYDHDVPVPGNLFLLHAT